MRSALTIIPLFGLVHLGLADFGWSDIPDACRNDCTPVVNLFNNCAQQVGVNTTVNFPGNGKVGVNNGGVEVDVPGLNNDPGKGSDNGNNVGVSVDVGAEQRYADCVCNSQNSRTDIPNCSNCLVQNGYKDKEAGDAVRYCNFTSGAAPPPPGTTASPTSTLMTTNAAGSTILSTLSASPTVSPTGTFSGQPVQATGAASKLSGAQNVLVAAALLGLPAVL